MESRAGHDTALHSAPAAPSLWWILREAVAGAPRETQRTVAFGVCAWIGLIALQAYDSADTPGAAGLAEFLSAVCASAGGMLFLFGSLLEAGAEVAPAAGRDAPRAETFRRLLIALPVIALAAASLLAAAMALMIVRAALGTPLVFAGIMAGVFAALFVLCARAAVRAARLLHAHARAEADAAAAARAEAREAQLAALQARMNPHFLFNALNTVVALIPTDPRGAERSTENLAEVLRLTLERTAERMGTVGEEIAYVRSYLDLEQLRFGGRLRVEWAIDPAIERAPLPPLVLQPLVENALRHGAEARLDGITIRIAVARSAGDLAISVDDDGPGFPPAHTEGTGLGNLRQRLASLYGTRAALEIDRGSPGAHVFMRIPFDPV
jgi:signal transduction histidine kinase